MDDEWYTPEQAAPLLGLTPAGVRSNIRDGRLKARKAGRRLNLVNAAEIERYRQRQQSDPKSRAWATRRAMAHMDIAANMPEPAPEVPEPLERRPLWRMMGGDGPSGEKIDGLGIVKPGDEGYDDEYDHAVYVFKRGGGMPYATDDEVRDWDAARGKLRRKGQGNG